MITLQNRRKNLRRSAAARPFGLEHLESRQLLAGTPFTGTTADGDFFTVTVIGPGQIDTGNTSANSTGISALALTGTTTDSILRITVRKTATSDGRITLNSLNDATLKQIDAKPVDFTGFLNLSSLRSALSFGSYNGTLIVNGPAGGSLTIGVDSLTNSTLTVNGAALALTSQSILNSSVTAAVLSQLNITGNRATSTPGDFSGDLTVGNVPATGVRSITVAGTVRGGTWTIPGNVGSITLGATTTDGGNNPFTLNVTGNVRSLTSSTGALSGNFSATTFGSIRSNAGISGSVTATGVDSAGKGIGSLTATNAANLNLTASGTNAAIGSITVVNYSVGNISAASIGTLTTRGATGVPGDLAANITLSGTGTSLNSARIAGSVLGGTWNFSGGVNSITAGAFALNSGNASLSLSATGAVKSLTTTIGSIDASLIAGTFGSIRSKTDITGSIEALGQDTRANGIASIFANTASDLSIIAGATGAGVGSVSFLNWNQGSLNASFLGTLTTRGSASNAGDLQADVTLSGITGRDSLSSVSIKGAIRSSNLRIAGNAGSFSTTRIFDSIIQVGTASNVTTLPADGSVLATDGGNIRSIRITAAFDTGSPSFSNTIIVARNIATVSSTGFAQTNNGGTAFGFAVRTITSFSARNTNGMTGTARNITTQQQADNAGLTINDFTVRII